MFTYLIPWLKKLKIYRVGLNTRNLICTLSVLSVFNWAQVGLFVLKHDLFNLHTFTISYIYISYSEFYIITKLSKFGHRWWRNILIFLSFGLKQVDTFYFYFPDNIKQTTNSTLQVPLMTKEEKVLNVSYINHAFAIGKIH